VKIYKRKLLKNGFLISVGYTWLNKGLLKNVNKCNNQKPVYFLTVKVPQSLLLAQRHHQNPHAQCKGRIYLIS